MGADTERDNSPCRQGSGPGPGPEPEPALAGDMIRIGYEDGEEGILMNIGWVW